MENKKYKLSYLPIFQDDLFQAVDYIMNDLKNPITADNLVNNIEKEILKRLDSPTSFEPYKSHKDRTHLYYRIYIGNYIVYYVVIGDVMEVRRLIYGKRDIPKII